MDDIIQRMLEVERKAESLVSDAEVEAEKTLAEGRRTASELESRLRRELSESISEFISERVAEAEARKAEALEAADQALRKRLERFETHIAAKRRAIKEAVAYP